MLTQTTDAQERIFYLPGENFKRRQKMAGPASAIDVDSRVASIPQGHVLESFAEYVVTGTLAIAERFVFVLLTGLCFALRCATALLDLL